MQYNKQAITLTQQVSILKQRGLIFANEQDAMKSLGNIGYFRLAFNEEVTDLLSLSLHL